MAMFCHQCQETAGNKGCAHQQGVCGKQSEVANLQDLLIWALGGLAWQARAAAGPGGAVDGPTGEFIAHGLFTTITNANFDRGRFLALVREAVERREALRESAGGAAGETAPECARWVPDGEAAILERAAAGTGGWLEIPDEELRSLRAIVLYGLKGLAAYIEHARRLKEGGQEIFSFLTTTLAALSDGQADRARLAGLVQETGRMGVAGMKYLDEANARYGDMEITRVPTGVRGNPGILVTGHDLLDLEQLLEQTRDRGVDVYTHGEMLPAHYRPFFRKYPHLAGNYGNSWHLQKEEMARFNGPILFTSNCLVPPAAEYVGRVFTTGSVGFAGARHIPDPPAGQPKDFSALIAAAGACPPPEEMERGEIIGGFGHRQVLALADKIIAAVKAGKIRRFIVMAGCDGRQRSRDYYTQVAEKLPPDTVILTAGCAKYRYLKLPLGDIDGIPRVIDAGQCNDSYSLAVVAMALQKAFALEDINDLPISYDIAWYEQKAVLVLLALLSLGVKGIRLGPTLPGFLSPGTAALLTESFGIKAIGDPEGDITAMLSNH